MARLSRRLEGGAAFDAVPFATVMLDRDFVIRAANGAYLRTLGRVREQLISFRLFDAFPEDPAALGRGEAAFTESFERVLRSGRPDRVGTQRYDVLDGSEPPSYQERRWVGSPAPVRDGDDIVGIVMRLDDVTGLSGHAVDALDAGRLRALSRVAATATDGSGAAPVPDAVDEPELTVEVPTMVLPVAEVNALGEEIAQLREALTSRSTIDQAKGMLMAQRGCTPDEAFGVLVKMSNDTNVRVADVAAALVYRTQRQR